MKTTSTNWIKIPHFNIHGNNKLELEDKKEALNEMFKNTSFSTMTGILNRYKTDFLICGYNLTWSILNEIRDKKEIQ